MLGIKIAQYEIPLFSDSLCDARHTKKLNRFSTAPDALAIFAAIRRATLLLFSSPIFSR